ncbi:MAG: alpha/beta fold hydrolase [Planctomycetota bacterium]
MSDQTNKQLIETRHYGSNGPVVLALHGGPAAPGYMVPIARRLADRFRVIEPLQRPSAPNSTLTVWQHIDDLNDVIDAYCEKPPMIVGHSWGAMLALAHAAAHPESVGGIVLVGCGSFNAASRERMEAIRNERMDAIMQARFDRLKEDYPDPNKRLGAIGRLWQEIDSYDLVSLGNGVLTCDMKAHQETWQDVVRLQDEGIYPETFTAITSPVLMLHGNDDPHPGEMIRDSLLRYIPQLEYHSWKQCGHYPWLEKTVAADFYTVLSKWLLHTAEHQHC